MEDEQAIRDSWLCLYPSFIDDISLSGVLVTWVKHIAHGDISQPQYVYIGFSEIDTVMAIRQSLSWNLFHLGIQVIQ